jgi:beta-lactam-binding protein with PASTA domain
MSLRSCCCALWILVAATALAAAQTQRQPVPDFKGKTLQQVRAAAIVPGTKRSLFAAIEPQGPANGLVTAQTPAPGTYVLPGEIPLRLTLGNPPPGILQNILQAIAKNQQNLVQVPDVTRQNRTVASRTIGAAHLRPVFRGNDAGVVTQQSPAAGASVRQGTAVTLTLSLPLPQSSIVPSLLGKNLDDANAALAAASLRTGKVIGDNAGVVSAQDPPAGASVPPGTAVTVTLALTQMSIVPSLLGRNLNDANAALNAAALRLGAVTGDNTGASVVSAQDPVSGASVPPGTAVTITLAIPQRSIVPSLVGKNRDDANAALIAASLRLGAVTGDAADASVVSSQNPPAGTAVDPGTSVDVAFAAARQVVVPDLTQLTSQQAAGRLADFGLRIGRMSGPPGGHVGSQQPLAQSRVSPGTVVDIVLVPNPSLLAQLLQWMQSLPTWLIVLASAAGLAVVTGVTASIVHHFLRPPSTAYNVLTRKAAPNTKIRTDPSLRFKLVVRDGRRTAQSVVEREPAVTTRRRS